MAVIAAPARHANDLRDRIVRRAEVVGVWAVDCVCAQRVDTDWAAELLGDTEHRHEHATLEQDGYHVDSFAVERVAHQRGTAYVRLVCSITIKQQVLFEQQYVPLVRSGTAYMEILAGTNPGAAKAPGPNGALSPQAKFEKLKADFIRVYESKQLDLEAGIREIHAALIPGSLQTSVLAAYGQVLMSKRFLTSEDSSYVNGITLTVDGGRAYY